MRSTRSLTWYGVAALLAVAHGAPAWAASPVGRDGAAASPARGERKLESAEMAWRLTGAKVTNPGRQVRTPQGVLLDGYTIQAAADAASPGSLRRGRFVFTGSVFSPSSDRPGQLAGHWYLQGSWRITALGADAATVKVRHNPFVAEGTLRAELPFDPAAQSAARLEADVILEPSLVGDRWTRGEGRFTGNGRLEGLLQASVQRHPHLGTGVK